MSAQNTKKNAKNKNVKKPTSFAAAEKRRDILIRVALTAVVVVFAVVVGVLVIGKKDSTDTPQATPTSVTETGALRFASATPPPAQPKAVLTIYEDFQCPVCKQFEASFGPTIDQLRDKGLVVDYQPIAILDRASTNKYSSAAANASLCVADADKNVWPKFHSDIYAQQPAEGGNGLSDQQITDIAKAAGAPDSVASCISGRPYADYVAKTTKDVLDKGINATPTVLLNGNKLDLTTVQAFTDAVNAALA